MDTSKDRRFERSLGLRVEDAAGEGGCEGASDLLRSRNSALRGGALLTTEQTRRYQLDGLVAFADPEGAFLEGDLEGHGTIRQCAEGLDLFGGVLPDDEVVYAGELVYPGDSIGGEWFTLEIIEDWITARQQDFTKGFVSCLRAGRRS